MNSIVSIIFYIILFCFVLFCFRKNSQLRLIALVVLVGISVLRWDIGNDYFSYYLNIQNIEWLLSKASILTVINSYSTEPTFILLTFIFSIFPDPPLWVIGSYFICTLTLWYITLKYYKGLFWGFFAIFFLCFFYNSYDQIRQALAMAIGLYSYRYIDTKEIKYFIITSLIATLIHFSGIIILLFYFCRLYKPNIILYVSILIFLSVAFYLQLWQRYFESLFILTTYADYALDLKRLDIQEFSSGLGAICWILINSFVCIRIYKIYPIISNIIFIGICIYLFGSGNHLIERVSRYGTIYTVLGLPLYFNSISKQVKYPVIKILLVFIIFIYGIKTTFSGGIGCIPYNSIFSKDYKEIIFKPREGRWE